MYFTHFFDSYLFFKILNTKWPPANRHPSWAEKDSDISGKAEYCGYIVSPVEEPQPEPKVEFKPRGVVKNKGFNILKSDDCKKSYQLDLKGNQFCGVPEDKVIFEKVGD